MTLNFKAFSFESIAAINQALDQLDRIEEGPMALITTGGNKKIYSAGMDLKIFQKRDNKLTIRLLKEAQSLFARFLASSYPNIAAINGHCIAGGVIFAMAHDFRVMVDGPFKFYLSEMDAGMNLPPGMSNIVQSKILKEVELELV